MGLVFSVASAVWGLFIKQPQTLSERFTPLPGITLYNNEVSPCARRVHMTLLEKGMKFRKVEVDLTKGEQLSAEYQHVCPNKKVPAIAFVNVPGVEDGFLFESNVITEFLDSDAFPGPKLYPVNAWERAQVKMWQDWELGLVDDFVPFVYSNLLPFVYQLIFGQKEQYMASLPANISPAKREHLSNVYDASLTTPSELKQHAIICYQNLTVLETALEGREFLVGDSFTSADLSVLPRVAMYNDVGLTIPECHFPNVVDYLTRLGDRYSIRYSQSLMSILIPKLLGSSWAVTIGNWRAGRKLERLDGSLYVEQALSQLPADRGDNPGWKSAVQETEWNGVLVADCPCCPECWQIKLLLCEKGVKYKTFTLPHQDVVGRWAGSGGLIRIHHNGHDIVGIRAVLDYLDATFSQDAPRLFPKDPLERAKVQSWQAWDQTTGYLELAPLLEMKLVSLYVAQRYAQDLPELYKLSKNPQYQSRFSSILQCFICGLVGRGDSSSVLEEVRKEHGEVITRATEALKHQNHWEDLLEGRLKHLDAELKKKDDMFINGKKLTVADITVFCRLSFLSGLGMLPKKNYETVTDWLEDLKESRPHFLAIGEAISDMFSKLNA